MYKITFYNNEIEREEHYKCETFKELLRVYLEIQTLPWWDCDIKNLKILKNNKDITKKVNKILEG